MALESINRIRIFFLILLLFLVTTSLVQASSKYHGKMVVGKKEEVLIFAEQYKYQAKLDTGAKTTSLSAIDIQEIIVNSKIWIAFKVLNPKTQQFVKKQFPLKRYVYIKQHRTKNKIINNKKRPVVLLPVCLGKQLQIIEVNLIDRRHFTCPVLLGRDAIIKFNTIVDPKKIYTVVPNCEVKL